MCELGLLARAHPAGSWKSQAYNYALFEEYYPDIDLYSISEESARFEVVRYYLSAYGPVTMDDIIWWTGFAKSEVRSALKQLKKDIVDYVLDRTPKHFRKTMQNLEKTWIYNYARAYAIANYTEDNTRVIDGGGSGDANWSIIAVRWEPGEITGLYDAEGFGKGKVFDVILESDGAAYRDKDDRTVKSAVVKNYLGFKFANPRYVTAMVNIANAATPTEAQLGDLIDDADGATVLYMHPTMARRISKAYGTDKIEYTSSDTNMSQTFMSYDGVPIVTSRQFDRGTEADVTLA